MLPPDSTTAIGGVSFSGRSSRAATPAAPAGSTTCLARSRHSSRARDRLSSDTVSTSAPSSHSMLRASSPGRATAIPSAMVGPPVTGTGVRAAIDSGYGATSSACTPVILMSGSVPRAAIAIPAASPPPPTGTTIVRTPGHCSAISRPTVPCPAMMSGCSNGWMNTEPCSLASSWAFARASSIEAPCSTMSAP